MGRAKMSLPSLRAKMPGGVNVLRGMPGNPAPTGKKRTKRNLAAKPRVRPVVKVR